MNCRCLCCQLQLWGRGWRGAGLIAEVEANGRDKQAGGTFTCLATCGAAMVAQVRGSAAAVPPPFMQELAACLGAM